MALSGAARTYAKHLPGVLHANWGASEFYTVDQVRAAIARRHLKGRYLAVAYASYLSEQDYLAIAADLPLVLPYDIAREVFRRAQPSGDAFSAQRDSETTSAPVITREL